MANFVVFHPRAGRNYSESNFTNQSPQSQSQLYDLRSPNAYNAKPYSNLSPNNPLLMNMPQNKYRSPKDQDDQLRYKEKSLLGNSYSQEPSFQQIQNIKHYGSENNRGGGGGGGFANRPKPELKSFLSQLSSITSSPNNLDWSRKQENNMNNGSSSAGISSLWRDPVQDRAKKNQQMNEWKQTLAAQVQARQVQKQREVEYQRIQEYKDEERYNKQFQEQGRSPSPAHQRDNKYYNKEQSPYENYTPQPQRHINLSPAHNIPNSYHSSPKPREYEGFSLQKKASYPQQQQQDHHYQKPRYSQSPSLPSVALNSYIDQLKGDILQSQKLFMEQMNQLKEDVDKSRHARNISEKHLQLSPKKDYSMRFQSEPVDILDNYVHIHNGPYYNNTKKEKNDHYNQKHHGHSSHNRNKSPRHLSQQFTSVSYSKFNTPEEPEFNLDLVDPGSGITQVQNKFIDPTENFKLEMLSPTGKKIAVRTQDDFYNVRRESIGIDDFKSEKLGPKSESDGKGSRPLSGEFSIDLDVKESKQQKQQQQQQQNQNQNQKEQKEQQKGQKEVSPDQTTFVNERATSPSDRKGVSATEHPDGEEEAIIVDLEKSEVRVDTKKKEDQEGLHRKGDKKKELLGEEPLNLLEKLELELEELEKPSEELVDDKKENMVTKDNNGTAQKKPPSPRRIWIEAIEPDNENMFDVMTSVFVNTAEVGSMADLRDYRNKREGKKDTNLLDDVQRTEYAKRNLASLTAVETTTEDVAPPPPADLMNKEEKEKYKKRDLKKRGTNPPNQGGIEKVETNQAKDKPAQKNVTTPKSIKKRI